MRGLALRGEARFEVEADKDEAQADDALKRRQHGKKQIDKGNAGRVVKEWKMENGELKIWR